MKSGKITIENSKVHISQSVNIWMTQHEIANFFGCFISKVNSNIRSILKSNVLCESDVWRTCYYQNGNFVEQYNLKMIIALAFRIQSKNVEVFREWLIRKTVRNDVSTTLVLSLQNALLN